MGILIGVFCVAIFVDMCHYRIPNWCVAAGSITGLIVTGASYSALGVLEALTGMVFVFFAFYPFYLLGGIGAGDVKLFMTVGSFLRGEMLFAYLLMTMIIAAILSAGKMLLFAESRERLFYLGRYLKKAVLTGCVDLYEIDKTQKKCVIRLSIPALLGLLLIWAGM